MHKILVVGSKGQLGNELGLVAKKEKSNPSKLISVGQNKDK